MNYNICIRYVEINVMNIKAKKKTKIIISISIKIKRNYLLENLSK